MKEKKRIFNKTQFFLLFTGGSLCLLLLALAAGQLYCAPIGSFGALERRVCAYIEHALSCFLIPLGAAAVIEMIGTGE